PEEARRAGGAGGDDEGVLGDAPAGAHEAAGEAVAGGASGVGEEDGGAGEGDLPQHLEQGRVRLAAVGDLAAEDEGEAAPQGPGAPVGGDVAHPLEDAAAGRV